MLNRCCQNRVDKLSPLYCLSICLSSHLSLLALTALTKLKVGFRFHLLCVGGQDVAAGVEVEIHIVLYLWGSNVQVCSTSPLQYVIFSVFGISGVSSPNFQSFFDVQLALCRELCNDNTHAAGVE